VTFSGGEPLLQAPFLTETLGRLRAEDVHTALDTCGFSPWEALREAAGLTSLVLYDLKLMDDARHRAATGQSNRIILDNLKALSGLHRNIWVRVPIIPGINDDETNLEATARFLAPLAGIRQVDLLPYHRTGEAKFARMGRTYALPGLQPPTTQRLEALAAIFRARGLTTTLGGHP
jgi:pyruvate formate lyase activating enzyme